MQFLVDTDWVIDYLNGIQAVSQRFDELRSQGIGLSIVSLAELYEGVLGADDPKADESALLDFLADIDVLAVDLTVCRIFADERRRLRATRTLISDFDLLIGGHRHPSQPHAAHQQPRHFARLRGLPIVSV